MGPEATIERLAVEAGHDGDAELMVQLRTTEGALVELNLDGAAAARLVEATAVESADDLIGIRFPWEAVAGDAWRCAPKEVELPA